jgi:dienelactone hydrolase
MVPALRNGTDGDGSPEVFYFATEFKPFIATITWNETLKPRIIEAVAIVKAKGAQQIGSLGFCFCGWNICKSMADEDIPEISFGVIPHPSIANANAIFADTDVNELIEKVRGPIAFLPAGNDPVDYRLSGAVYETLSESVASRYGHK